jgi:PST family polysaccharide transporter
MSRQAASPRREGEAESRPLASEDPLALIVEPVGEAPDAATVVGPRAGRFKFSESLRVRAARGTLINTGFLLGLAGLNLVRAFVLAGLVSRSDYGLWGILIISLGTILWLKQVGIGDKFIQQDEADQEVAFQKAFTMELVLTGGFVALVAVALPLIAAIYGLAQLILPGLVVLAAFIVAVFQAPLWVFYRRMEFGRQRLLQALDPVVAFIVSVALAVAGAGYWAFVGGFFAGVAAATVGAVLSSPYRFRIRFDRATLRDYASFAWPLFVAGAAALVAAQAAFLTSRWELGLAATGAITLATSVTAFTDRADTLVTDTLYPAICAVKDRMEILTESFVKSNRLALMWAVPFGVGLALFASDLVTFGIGERWRPAVVVLQVVGVAAAVNHIGFNWTAFLQARGTTRPIAVASVAGMAGFLAVGVPLIFAIGIPGFAIGLAAQTGGQLAARGFYLRRFFSGFSYLGHIARAFLPTIPAAALVLLLHAVDGANRSLAGSLAELAGYVAVTLAATWYFESRLLREAVGYVFAARRPTEADAPVGA